MKTTLRNLFLITLAIFGIEILIIFIIAKVFGFL